MNRVLYNSLGELRSLFRDKLQMKAICSLSRKGSGYVGCLKVFVWSAHACDGFSYGLKHTQTQFAVWDHLKIVEEIGGICALERWFYFLCLSRGLLDFLNFIFYTICLRYYKIQKCYDVRKFIVSLWCSTRFQSFNCPQASLTYSHSFKLSCVVIKLVFY